MLLVQSCPEHEGIVRSAGVQVPRRPSLGTGSAARRACHSGAGVHQPAFKTLHP